MSDTKSLKKRSDSSVFHQVMQIILSTEGSETLHKTIVESAILLFEADYVLMGLYDQKKRIINDYIKSCATENTDCRFKCQRIMDTVCLTHLPLKMDTSHPVSAYFFSPGNSKQSFLAIPVMVQEKLYAVLIIGNLYTGASFTNTDIETGTLFASYVALIIRNDILLKDTSYRAQTDFLTGLYNYRHIIEAANIEISRAKRYNHPLTAIMFDIDHFKAVNDAYGHTAGDQVLCTIAELCLQLFRNIDIVCRYGGEEFFVLLPETSIETAKEVAERLRISVQNKVTVFHKQPITITISLGIASISSSCTTIIRLIERADTALYCAKKNGRNRTVVWSPSIRPVAFDHSLASQPHTDTPTL
ncbi:MAG: sensor domain-containing diguanylate cyclase [Fibrobacter sp.]|nr:sensor domain-containing diguanylate cyclase [Fibrobacter sp.]